MAITSVTHANAIKSALAKQYQSSGILFAFSNLIGQPVPKIAVLARQEIEPELRQVFCDLATLTVGQPIVQSDFDFTRTGNDRHIP